MHAIIYIEGELPQCTRKELLKGLSKEPLSVLPSDRSTTLHKMSRVNFAKAYTVDYTVQVKDIGQISNRSMPKLMRYWSITMKD